MLLSCMEQRCSEIKLCCYVVYCVASKEPLIDRKALLTVEKLAFSITSDVN